MQQRGETIAFQLSRSFTEQGTVLLAEEQLGNESSLTELPTPGFPGWD